MKGRLMKFGNRVIGEIREIEEIGEYWKSEEFANNVVKIFQNCNVIVEAFDKLK